MKFIRHLRDVMRLMQLPKSQRKLTFYSEGKNYWPHLEGLIKEILAIADTPICYISSEENDPGLLLKHPNYRTFKIDEGFVRNWLFENIDTDIMVMTMPDLHQYQAKRSKHKIHYVYVQHSLVSLHMIYRKGAFDYYDTIFCAGPHHVKEIRAMESKYNLPPKILVEHGYSRLDNILVEAKKRPKKETSTHTTKHALIAPSWGPECIIESGIAEKIVDQLLGQDCQVTLRPHPQTIKLASNKVEAIINKYGSHPLFTYESNVAGQESLHNSNIMISDWSGAALDYSFGLNKPVLFMDVPKKVNNPDYKDIGIEPFESFIRGIIGNIITPEKTDFSLSECLMDIRKYDSNRHVFNLGKADKTGASYIYGLATQLETKQ